MTAAETVYNLLASTRKPLTQIALEADVSYDILWRWVKSGGMNKYDVISAERIYTSLTGKTFITDDNES